MDRNISQLAHVEILSPQPDDTTTFLKDVIGLEETQRGGQSVWLRGWGEWLHSSLIVTESETSGLGHIGWRSNGPEALNALTGALTDSDSALGWVEDNVGHGPAFRFRAPEGHVHEVFWEAERYLAPPELRSKFPNRPQRYLPRGAGARRLDHVTLGALDVEAARRFYLDALPLRYMEGFGITGVKELGAFMTSNAQSHDLAVINDPSGISGRLNHVALWVDSEVELRRAADILVETPNPLELGPERHGLGENFCLYVREPGGNRIEVFTGPGYANYLPDWEAVFWDVRHDDPGSYYGREIPATFHALGSPPAEGELDRAAQEPDSAGWAAPHR